jgi:thiazolylpeptide-type bacteriocin precursor
MPHMIDSLVAELSQLESETFEIADYAETNDLFAIKSCSTSSTSSTTSSTCA